MVGENTAEDCLKNWLTSSEYTQTRLAAELGVTRAAVSKWCNGAMSPSKWHASELEKLTGGSVPASLWPRRELPEPSSKGARALQAAAARRGLSITQLSRATGIPTRAMHRWAVGQHAPRKNAIAVLNSTLGLKLTVQDFEVAA